MTLLFMEYGCYKTLTENRHGAKVGYCPSRVATSRIDTRLAVCIDTFSNLVILNVLL